jgi:hypothetical protein
MISFFTSTVDIEFFSMQRELSSSEEVRMFHELCSWHEHYCRVTPLHLNFRSDTHHGKILSKTREMALVISNHHRHQRWIWGLLYSSFFSSTNIFIFATLFFDFIDNSKNSMRDINL